MATPTSVDRIYFDYNASAPLRPEARAALIEALDRVGNASSVHAEGRAARALLEEARIEVATLAGAEPKSVIFTSGATEAANLTLSPTLRDGGAPITELLISASEHVCVLSGHRFDATRLRVMPVDSHGRLDLAALDDTLGRIEGRPALALQAANNETGVIQPVAEAARLVHARGGLLLCDAVQAAGRVVSNAATLDADALFLSSHKIGGPKGVGALVFARPALHIEEALVRGGGQERGLRAGTENVAAAAGFAAASRLARSEFSAEPARLAALRDHLESGLRAATPEVTIFGDGVERLPNTSAFAIPGLTAETLLIALDIEGVAVSSGSACSSGKVRASHVLAAMGIEADLAKGALRISLGWASREEEVGRFCETFGKIVRSIRARRTRSAA